MQTSIANQVQNNPANFYNYEVLITRNTRVPSLFNLVLVDFFKEDLYTLESNLSFEDAVDRKDFYESLIVGMDTKQLDSKEEIWSNTHSTFTNGTIN